MPIIEVQCLQNRCKLNMEKHTSDYAIRWRNFKGFKDTDWIKIKPITIIIGSNNAGKSSFLAPLLLMNQTITSNESTSPLILSDKVYEGGNVKELINGFDLKKEFTFGFRYHIHETDGEPKKVGYYPPGAFEVTFKANNEIDREISVISETIYDLHNRPMVKLQKNRFGNYQLTGSSQTLTDDEKKAIKTSEPLNFLFSPNSLLLALQEVTGTFERNRKQKRMSTSFSNLLSDITVNFNAVRNTLGPISYLGPIREYPHRYYRLRNINYHTVGAKGENVPDIINKRTEIKTELNEWVKKFCFGDTVEFRKFKGSNTMGSIVFKNKGERHYTNIANSGFGASQILPLIIQALVSPANRLTIAEQPEIHLNPKLQGVLAELFCFMAEKKQRVIIETHSEHMLLRLRRLVAAGFDKDKIALYFVEKKKGESTIREIKIDQNGNVPSDEWPEDFFADTLKESLALASQQSINRNKKKSKKK